MTKKLSLADLAPPATFKVPVSVPLPGTDPIPITFECRYRTRSELEEFLKASETMEDAEFVTAVAVGWDLEDAFNADNVKALTNKLQATPVALLQAYLQQLRSGRSPGATSSG